MITVEIQCDECGRDLKYTSYSSEAYISMTPTWMSHRPRSAAFAMDKHPPINREYHFCNVAELIAYFDRPKDKQ